MRVAKNRKADRRIRIILHGKSCIQLLEGLYGGAEMINGELIVDNFAGGGGTSTGIELATGYSVDIAINHDPEAIKKIRI